MTIVSAEQTRVIELENVKNFRDMGGYLADGGTVAWGRLFRADGLNKLSDADLDVVDALGIRTVIDLRTSRELTDAGRFPVEKMPVAFHHVSVIDRTWHEEGREVGDDAAAFLTSAYRDMLGYGADRFAEALRLIALPEAGPLVFHCAAGKDRTGVLAALLLAALGVADEDIADDYALTKAGMDRLFAWARASRPEMLARINEAPAAWMAVEPEAIVRLLADLRRDFGSMEQYLSSIGVGQALVDELRAAYVV
jgi:protein-tyrosine phosphatase